MPPLGIELGKEPALALVDGVVRQTFALDRYFAHVGSDYPTTYCGSLEEFFSHWAAALEISPSARQAFVGERAGEARRAAEAGQGGIYGVNFPGRGCYINGWLFALTAGVADAAAALGDALVFSRIISTIVHEKWGHGFIALYTAAGREKQQLDLWQLDVAQRFGQRLSEDPQSALLRQKLNLLGYTSRYLEEGWATWIEHYVTSRVYYTWDGQHAVPHPPQQAYKLADVWEAIERLKLHHPTGEVRIMLDDLSWALQVLFLADSPEVADVHRATLILQAVEQHLAQPMGQMLGQPLPYALGDLTMQRIESQQGAFCVPYAVAVAANVDFGVSNMALADLHQLVHTDPRYNLDSRLLLLSQLRLDEPGSVRELTHRAREQLSLAVPDAFGQ